MRLLIIDLDETLIHSEFEYQMEGNYDFKISFDDDSLIFVKKRPNLNIFLDYAFKNFKVAIWTASTEKYARSILERCNVDINKLEFLWTREKCIIKNGFYHSYGLKKLSDINYIGLKDILIIDDVEETASNNPDNLILIKPYIYGKDKELLEIIKYLEIVKNEPDYRKLNNRDWKSQI